MTYSFTPTGVCSRRIDIELDAEGIIRHVAFLGGCSGNTQGISALVEGQRAEDVMGRLRGIRCGFRPTSCPDQLAQALEEALEQL